MQFTLELFSAEGALIERNKLTLSTDAEVWARVVARARRIKGIPGARIRVIDASGGVVVQTRATMALLIDERTAA